MQDRGEIPKKKPASKTESPPKSPIKTAPPSKTTTSVPPPAPKPEKQVSSFKTTIESPKANNDVSLDKPATFNVSVDIGGKKENMDFGIPASDESFPAPPPLSNSESASDFSAPPPPSYESEELLPSPPPFLKQSSASTTEAAPAIPPLPEEFQEKTQVSNDSYAKANETVSDG